MPDKKISELTEVLNLLPTDEFVLARSSATNKITGQTLAAYMGGVGALDYATAAFNAVNDNTEQTLYTFTVPGDTLGENGSLDLRIQGDVLHNNAGGDSLRIRIKWGGTTIWDSGTAINFGGVTSANRQPWTLQFVLGNLGATNAQDMNGKFEVPFANTGAPTTGIGGPTSGAGQAIAQLACASDPAKDTTADQVLAVTVQWSATSINDSFRRRIARLLYTSF